MQSLFCSTGVVITAHMSQHMALGGGWGIWPLSLWRRSPAHPVPGHRLQGKEHISEVVLWAECDSSALTPNLGRYGAARSPLFSLQMPFILPCVRVRAPFPMAFPQPEVHRHTFSRQVTSYLMGPLKFSPSDQIFGGRSYVR